MPEGSTIRLGTRLGSVRPDRVTCGAAPDADGPEMRWPSVAAGAVALVGAVLLAGAPRGEVERVVALVTVEDVAPIEAHLVVDTEGGEIRSEQGRLASFVRSADVRMALRGTSGAGVVTVRVLDPTGEPVIHDQVGPDASFDLSAPVASDIDIEVAATPASVPAPGGQVLVRIELTLRSGMLGPVELVWADTWSPWLAGPFGPEEEHPGTIEPLSSLGAPRPDGCGLVLGQLPVELELDVPLVCTFVADVAGEPGDQVTGEIGLLVASGDLIASVSDAEVTLLIVEPGHGADEAGDASDDAQPADRTVDDAAAEIEVEHPELPRHGTLVGDAGGDYAIEVVAVQGSPGLTVQLEWFEPAPPVGAVLAGLWFVAGVLALTVGIIPHRLARIEVTEATLERLAGAMVGVAGFAVIGALWVTADRAGLMILGGAHAWYWTPGFLVLGVATLLLIVSGALIVSPGAPRSWRRGLGWPLLISGAVLAATAVAVGIAGFAHGTEGATYYAGDYLLLAAHLQATVFAGVLLGVGGLLHGTRSQPTPRVPASTGPERRPLTGVASNDGRP